MLLKSRTGFLRHSFTGPGDLFSGPRRRAELIIDRCDALGIRILGHSDGDFPEALRRIPDPPVLLFVKGDFDGTRTMRMVAVVGTRQPTTCGREAATRCAGFLARWGVCTVSGLALGCDTGAHEGALAAGGSTVAVLAHGLDTIYPSANRGLAGQILEKGYLVSEYPPGVTVARRTFVERDRLQSGLSEGVIVVQTGRDGGSMHTARFCLEQGRRLGCLYPSGGFPSDGSMDGNRQLIESGGALAIRNPGDLEAFLEPSYSNLAASVGEPGAPALGKGNGHARQLTLFDDPRGPL